MKLVMAILRDDFAPDVSGALTEIGLSVTRISSTGGFWRRGYVTLLAGVEDHDVDRTLETINAHAGPEMSPSLAPPGYPPRRATVWVINVDRFARF
ncbi:MAG: hypothetical protein GX657_02280 [Chloroflexi bacterium]|jgi:uncharacterized protein YaaQ|nr:hypothetical protein [Chloroflexota bacterium]